MMLFQFFYLVALAVAQTTVASWSPDELSSASSRALASDASLIYNVLLNLNSEYTTYLRYMDSHGMQFPASVAQYMVKIQTINDETSLMNAVKTIAFPFNDFQTMMTMFPWYTTLMQQAGASTFYQPSDFLIAQETRVASASSSTAMSSISSKASSSASSSSISATSSSSSKSDAASTTSSTNSVGLLSIPITMVVFLMAL